MTGGKLKRHLKNRLRNTLYNLASWYALKKGITERFMNFGYDEASIELKPGDINDKLHIQLYNIITSGPDFRNKNVLEVGCGRGGGCYFIKNYKGAGKVTGIDLSDNNIKIARKLVTEEGIAFSRQNAEELHFQANSFDIIVNLESAHGYPRRKFFYQGVFSLLKPGGHFIYADVFTTKNIPIIKDYLFSLGFKPERETDITRGVLRSLEMKELKRFSFLKKNIVPLFLKSFYGTNKGYTYNEIRSGRQKYMSFVFTKT